MDHPSSPVYVIVAVFPDENDARLTLKKAQTEKKFVMKRAVALRCDRRGLLRFSEVCDVRPGREALLGGVIGGFIGLLGKTVVAPLKAGAVIGSMAAHLRDSGFPEDSLQPLIKMIQRGTSLIVVQIEPPGIGEVEWMLQQAGADVSLHELRGEVVTCLESGQEIRLHRENFARELSSHASSIHS